MKSDIHANKQRYLPGPATAGLVFLAALAAPADDALAVISQVPLILGQNVEPNIMFTLDDSGSMHFEFMPENGITQQDLGTGGINGDIHYFYPAVPNTVYGTGTTTYPSTFPTFEDDPVNAYLRSSENNKIYYNPAVTYQPWSNSDGSLMTDANPAAAFWNPGNTAAGTYDLTQEKINVNDFWAFTGTASISPIDVDCDKTEGDNSCQSYAQSFWPMVYWLYDGAGDKFDVGNYTKVEFRGVNGVFLNGVDSDMATLQTVAGYPPSVSRTYAQAQQNFANWFQYYRSRVLLAKAGAGRAFAQQGTGIRVGFATINDLEAGSGVALGVRNFSGTDRDTFFSTMYQYPNPRQNTPLRTAMAEVGQYFMDGSGNDSPWNNIPGNASSGQLACRQNYDVFTTDGYWNGADPSGIGNEDGSAGPTITGPASSFTYNPVPPYQDNYSQTLADVAMHYWKNDLRPDPGGLPNVVSTTSEDPAFWQHMVNFTVGLGVFGTLTPDDLPALTAGTLQWPNPLDAEDGDRIDDLFHAAVNSRGQFFSAADPDEFAQALSESLLAIAARIGAAASATTNTGIAIQGAAKIYQPLYRSGDWSGDLLAFDFDVLTGLSAQPSLKASEVLDTQDWNTGRAIITSKVSLDASGNLIYGDGVAFRWSDISLRQQILLAEGDPVTQPLNLGSGDGQGQDRLEYLRGNPALEGAGFRVRTTLLGDLVHSTPIFVGAPSARLHELPTAEGGGAYITFRDTNANRAPMLYVGANDGMLHAFNAQTLAEELAYIPAGVFDNLSLLTDPAYSHHYYVDNTATAGDVYFANNTWHTVLVGSTGAGGQAIFALDVTDPTLFNEASAASWVLWEINPNLDADPADGIQDYAELGSTFSRPAIVLMNDGQWAAVFGNGYGSASGHAVLYIANIETGGLIKAITLEDDSAIANGLSTPITVDINDDLMVDRIYAGDLEGNLWVVDVSGDTPADWGTAFGNENNPDPLFDGADTEPITVRPEVVRHPIAGQAVLFGTGKYFETGDNVIGGGTTVQSFYGIWDSQTTSQTSSITRAGGRLVEQDIIPETTASGVQVRVTTSNPVNYAVDQNGVAPGSDLGWFMDFNTTDPNINGEKVVRDPLVRAEKLVFTTLVPSVAPCAGGGSGWLMELNPITGARLPFTPFDIDNNHTFDSGDYIEVTIDGNTVRVPASGVKTGGGVPSRPAVVVDPSTGTEYKFVTGSLGETRVIVNNPGPQAFGRQSWQQLR